MTDSIKFIEVLTQEQSLKVKGGKTDYDSIDAAPEEKER